MLTVSRIRRNLFCALLLALSAPALGAPERAHAAEPQDSSWTRPLPIGASWALERGVDLPNPFGVSVFFVTMSRDITVTDARVTLPGNEPVSVSDVASFAVRNSTTLATVKFDAWILPVLDLYVLAGQTWTDSRLTAAITIDRGFGGPTTIEVTQDADVQGPLLGGGATLVAGYGPWFVLCDANYSYSDVEEFDDGIGAVFVSARTGWSGRFDRNVWRAWLGAAYLETDRTISLSVDSATLGTVVVEVDQRPVHPWTAQAGGGIGLGKRWELLLEAGSNFDDAFLGVFSASYRF